MVEANLGPLAPPPPPPPPPPPFNPRPQSYYFYPTRWTKHVDMAFIQALYYKAVRGQKQLLRTPNMDSLNYARSIVNACFNWSSKYVIFKRRLERLRLRFSTFKSIIDSPGFQWDRRTNFVSAIDEQWNDLALIIPLLVGGTDEVCTAVPLKTGRVDDGLECGESQP
ncbi:hypothetical protein Salat_2491300 [Sesamum alatum]|uniref:Myb/SANT-like domain-containing protein n=1 Tax=Sesamum alatum TaxID=300844 RepID=A0AAE2CC23_9LAMI|nr:hypothetical protein Salat_2491300 [Sesamum alatum]